MVVGSASMLSGTQPARHVQVDLELSRIVLNKQFCFNFESPIRRCKVLYVGSSMDR
jgi:hypothetical protein